ncbi:MAG: hypothetical protein M3O70_09260 [Actinomycetota bacterium]|nr:hypothetical protein [Actinomycetota bacterium]
MGVSLWFARQQVLAAKRTREDETRPFVVLDFDLDTGTHIISLVVENIGKTVARDVRIEFDEIPTSTLDPQWALSRSTLLSEGLRTMPPKRRITAIFDQYPPRYEQGLPMRYEATARYRGESGKTYADDYVLDLGVYAGLGFIHKKGLHEIAKVLEWHRERLERQKERT